MIPVLYDNDSIELTRLGKGKLTETISCTVHEELNGDFSLEFQYPITGTHYNEIGLNSTVLVVMPCFSENAWKSPTIYKSSSQGSEQGMQLFDIYKISKPIDGVVTYYARHVLWRLKDCVYYKTSLSASSIYRGLQDSVPVTAAHTYSIYMNGIEIETRTPYSLSGTIPNSNPRSPLALFMGEEESALTELGCDLAYNVRYSGGLAITTIARISFLRDPRGRDYGVSIRHGYRMTDVEYEDDTTDTYNAVVPYWDDGSGNKTYVTGYVVQPTTPITPVKAVPMDCTQAFSTQPTGAQLAQYAQDWLDANTPWVSVKNITLDFVNGSETGDKAETISLGDTVRVYWEDADINIKLRAIAYDYDVLAERYSKIELGKQQENFVSVTGIDSGSGTQPQSRNVLLWTNAAPSSSFAAQDVNIANLDDFASLYVVYNVTAGDTAKSIMAFNNVSGAQYVLFNAYTPSSGYASLCKRSFTIGAGKLTFNAANEVFTNSNSRSTNNNRCVPTAIYGIK